MARCSPACLPALLFTVYDDMVAQKIELIHNNTTLDRPHLADSMSEIVMYRFLISVKTISTIKIVLSVLTVNQ